MRLQTGDPMAWISALGGVENGENFHEARGRNLLVAKARWLLLAAVVVYGLCAGGLYFFSPVGFFLTKGQLLTLILSASGIIAYNWLYHFRYDRLKTLRYADHLQILLDLLFVTLLIHFSGGAASWFWPVYLIVTLEAAVLLEKKEEVWGLGALGGLAYGGLLALEFQGILPSVRMPFVEPGVHGNALYLILMWFWVSILNSAMATIGPFLMGIVRRDYKALKKSEQRLLDFIESANDLIFSFTPEGHILYVNAAWKRSLGYGPEESSGLSLFNLVDPDSRRECLIAVRKVLAGGEANVVEGRFIAKDGCPIELEGNITAGVKEGGDTVIWAICRDITERKHAQEQLYHMAHHDMLTDLPNRLFFLDRLKQAKSMAKRLGKQVAVLFLDLDRFKIINDTLGHGVGDKLLQEAANRLTACVRETDTVARLGGDEFIILLDHIHEEADAEKVARKVLKEMVRPMCIDGHELFITTSVGICLCPQDDDDPMGMIKKADLAMYHAKGQGRNNLQFYRPDLDLDADRRLTMENSMRKALEREEFRIYYQPKVDIVTGRVTAMEALLRWEHPELGMLPPTEFIPLAEETGLILPLGEWVLRKACLQNRLWQEEGLAPVKIAVNLSGHQLQHKNLIPSICAILAETGLDPRWLELEITETVVMQNPDFAVGILKEIGNLGIHISIDDFGTGYSSLAHLKRFSVNTLKIDKSFVKDVELNSTDAAITTAIIAMGSSLNLKVIAEGVETEGQLSFLTDRKCHEIQGFLFSRPVPAEEAGDLLRRPGLVLTR